MPKKQAADAAIAVSIDGTTFVLRPSEVTASDVAALRRETGLSLRTVIDQAQNDPDLDVIAALVFMARRQAGDRSVTFDSVAAFINYESEIEAVDVPAEEEGDSPEA